MSYVQKCHDDKSHYNFKTFSLLTVAAEQQYCIDRFLRSAKKLDFPSRV